MAKQPQIDPAQPIPIYFQLKTLLLEDILGGRYDGDGRLPTEHELCEHYGISRTPVTRPISQFAILDGSRRRNVSCRSARQPLTMSYPSSSFARSTGMSCGSFCRSPSIGTMTRP